MRAIELFGEHRADQQVGPRGAAEADCPVGAAPDSVVQTVGAADGDPDAAVPRIAPVTEKCRKFLTVQILAAFIEGDCALAILEVIENFSRFALFAFGGR